MPIFQPVQLTFRRNPWTWIGEALACVGPVNMTVEQNKVFQFNSVNNTF